MTWKDLLPWGQKNNPEPTKVAVVPATPLDTAELPVRLQQEMNRFVDQFFGKEFFPSLGLFEPTGQSGASFLPNIDVTEDQTHVLVRAELPGVEPKDLEVQVTGQLLTIAGQKHEEKTEKQGNTVHTERRFGSFRRTVQLPVEVDTNQIDAEHRNGVLTIKAAKLPHHVAKQIQVKVN